MTAGAVGNSSRSKLSRMNWISRAPAAALILWIASSNPAFSQTERGDCAQDRAGVNCGSNTRGSGGSGSSSSGSDYNAARERQRALDELTSSLGALMEDSRQQRRRDREDRELERLRREQAEYEEQQRLWAEEERQRERQNALNLFWTYRNHSVVKTQLEIRRYMTDESSQPGGTNTGGNLKVLEQDSERNPRCSSVQSGVIFNNCATALNVAWFWTDRSGACELRADTLTACGNTLSPGKSLSIFPAELGGNANVTRCIAPSVPILNSSKTSFDCLSLKDANLGDSRLSDAELRERERVNKPFEQYLSGNLIDAQLEVATYLARPQPYRRTNSDGRVEVLNYSFRNMNPSCSSLQNGTVTNNCDTELNVGWLWIDAQGPCSASGFASTTCASALQPGASVKIVQSGSARMATCLAPDVPVLERDRSGFSCWSWKAEAPPARSKTGKAAIAQPSGAEDYSSQIGNKALLASEASLAALQKRGAISEYGFDKSLLASHCIRSFYETFPTGGKSSRLENTCDRKVHVSWFDSEGPCKERGATDWTCSTAIGPRKTIGATRQPDGARREFGACFDPGLPVRQGGRHSCAAWLNMGGSSYQPGTSFEPAEPR